MSRNWVFLFVLLPSLLSGCAAYRSYNRGETCDRSIREYSRLVRWSEMEKAVIAMVDQGQRDAYARTAESMRRRDVTMVDARILAQECHAKQGRAEATMEFDYFVMPDNRLKTVTDHQQWVYREGSSDDQVPGWKLITPPPRFR